MHLDKLEILPLLGAGALLFGRYVILPTVSHMVGVWAWKYTVKSEREAIEWWHHKYRIMRQGHQHPSVQVCTDNDCAKVTR